MMPGLRPRFHLFLPAMLAVTTLCSSGTEIQTTYTKFSVPRLSVLSISGDVSTLLSLVQDGSGESAYDLGYVESNSDQTILTIEANDDWDLSAKLAGAWSCPGSYNKSEDDLFVRITNTPIGTIQNGASNYINLSTTDTQILSHPSGVENNTVNVQTKVLLDWTQDVPGSYSITVTYTLVVHLP